jgi:hypothetical protein
MRPLGWRFLDKLRKYRKELKKYSNAVFNREKHVTLFGRRYRIYRATVSPRGPILIKDNDDK